MLVFLLCAILGCLQNGHAFRINSKKPSTPTLDMLDMMQQLMTGGGEFDRNFIKETRSCMATFDPQLPYVNDAIWQGIIDYWDMGGNPDDRWGTTASTFVECNVTVSPFRNMVVYEPCNSASNIAYYHLLNEVCNRRAVGSKFHFPPKYITAMGKMLAALPVASSFMHLTNTNLGSQQDVGIIRVLSYLLHQGIMDALPYRSSILNDLSPVPRPMTALQIVDAVQNMYSKEPVSKWFNIFESLDIPDYFLGFAGSITTILHMNFDDNLVNQFIPILVDGFGLTADHQKFITIDFLPELRRATSHMDRKKHFRANFLGNSISALGKMIHAFVWNERRVFTNPILLEPFTNMIGLALLPKVNRKINGASNFQYFKSHFQRGENIYPGEQWCNPKVAHAKWHVQSSLGVLDLIYLGDEMHRLLTPTRN